MQPKKRSTNNTKTHDIHETIYFFGLTFGLDLRADEGASFTEKYFLARVMKVCVIGDS